MSFRSAVGVGTTIVSLLLVLCSSGCVNRYVITTTSGQKIITNRKPKLVDSKYVYKQGTNTVEIPAMRVRVIEPYSKKAAGAGTRVPELQ